MQERVLIYLFLAVPALPIADVVHERVEDKVWLAKLRAILDRVPDMNRFWRELVTHQLSKG